MTTYTVTAPDNYPRPRISGSVGTDLQFKFLLEPSWKQLYTIQENQTHKISGISELFGSNSMRLGVRRHPQQKPGLVAVFYLHVNSRTTYTPLHDESGKVIILEYDTYYNCRIWQNGSYWQLDLFNYKMELLATASKQMTIGSFLFGRRLSSIFVEPSIFEPIRTAIEWVKK